VTETLPDAELEGKNLSSLCAAIRLSTTSDLNIGRIFEISSPARLETYRALRNNHFGTWAIACFTKVSAVFLRRGLDFREKNPRCASLAENPPAKTSTAGGQDLCRPVLRNLRERTN